MSLPNHKNSQHHLFSLFLGLVQFLVFGICLALLYIPFKDDFDWKLPTATIQKPRGNSMVIMDDLDRVENGIHLASGLVYTEHFDIIRGNCTSCHSGKLIAQNRATREGWEQMIRWMQQTQGLWDLGKNEALILDYLETYYAPQEVGRRSNLDLTAIEWYILEVEE